MSLRPVLSIAIAALIACASALGQTAAPTVPASGEVTPTAPAAAGLTVFRDPVTQQIRTPTASEMQQLSTPRMPPTLRPPLKMLRGPGNAVGVALDSSFASYVVVRKGLEGGLATACVVGENDADGVLAAAPIPAAPARRREWLDAQ